MIKVFSRALMAVILMAMPLVAAEAGSIAPDQALVWLREGNQRFVSGQLSRPHQDADRRKLTAEGQHPFAIVLSCSDSRAPVELLFDRGIGDLFTVRVAGNVARTDEVATIEYGVEHLGAPLVLVLGHTRCGAVTAVVQGAKAGAALTALLGPIAPAVANARSTHPDLKESGLIGEAIKENVRHTIEDLLAQSEIIREHVASQRLQVIGGVYHIETGAIEWNKP